jgi:transcriptional regulator with XRE-family HTH domain
MGRRKREALSQEEKKFRAEIAEKFSEAIRTRCNGNKTSAAFALGISRQALYNYLNGHQTPGGSVIQRACIEWQITLNDRGYMISTSSFPEISRELKPQPESPAMQQLSLFEAIQSLENEQLSIKVVQKSKQAIQLEVSLRFAG